MAHFAWAKVYCDLLRHPLLRDRPDCDVRLAVGLILEAKEHSDDGVIRNLTPASARGLCHIKASASFVKAGIEYLVAEGWLIPHPDQAYEIRDFVTRQAADSPSDRMRRMRDKTRDETVTKRHRTVTENVTVSSPDVEVETEVEVDKSNSLPTVAALPVVGKTVPTRLAYEKAFRERWRTDPLRGKSINGRLKTFVELVGLDDSPSVAEFYVSHNQAIYVNEKHPIGLLLRDAQKLHTEWKNGRAMTGTEAKQIERTEANGMGWGDMLKEKKA